MIEKWEFPVDLANQSDIENKIPLLLQKIEDQEGACREAADALQELLFLLRMLENARDANVSRKPSTGSSKPSKG